MNSLFLFTVDTLFKRVNSFLISGYYVNLGMLNQRYSITQLLFCHCKKELARFIVSFNYKNVIMI